MNFIRSNIKIFFIFFFTFFFGLGGLIYNNQLDNNWFIKYQIDMSPEVDIYSKTIDHNVASLDLKGGQFGSIIIFAQSRISKQKIVKNKNITNFQIKPDTIAFNMTGSTENLEEEVKDMILNLNDQLKYEINEIIDVYKKNAVDILDLEKKIGIEKVKETIQFYKNNNIKSSALSKQSLEMITSYLETYNTAKTEREMFERLKSELLNYEKLASIVTLEMILEKLENQKSEDVIELLIIKDMKRKINSLVSPNFKIYESYFSSNRFK